MWPQTYMPESDLKFLSLLLPLPCAGMTGAGRRAWFPIYILNFRITFLFRRSQSSLFILCFTFSVNLIKCSIFILKTTWASVQYSKIKPAFQGHSWNPGSRGLKKLPRSDNDDRCWHWEVWGELTRQHKGLAHQWEQMPSRTAPPAWFVLLHKDYVQLVHNSENGCWTACFSRPQSSVKQLVQP